MDLADFPGSVPGETAKSDTGGKGPSTVSTTTPTINEEGTKNAHEVGAALESSFKRGSSGLVSCAKELVNSTTTTSGCDSKKQSCEVTLSSDGHTEAISSTEVSEGRDTAKALSPDAEVAVATGQAKEEDAGAEDSRVINDDILNDKMVLTNNNTTTVSPSSNYSTEIVSTTSDNMSLADSRITNDQPSLSSLASGKNVMQEKPTSGSVSVTASIGMKDTVDSCEVLTNEKLAGVETCAEENLMESLVKVGASAGVPPSNLHMSTSAPEEQVVNDNAKACTLDIELKDIPSNCDSVQCVVNCEQVETRTKDEVAFEASSDKSEEKGVEPNDTDDMDLHKGNINAVDKSIETVVMKKPKMVPSDTSVKPNEERGIESLVDASNENTLKTVVDCPAQKTESRIVGDKSEEKTEKVPLSSVQKSLERGTCNQNQSTDIVDKITGISGSVGLAEEERHTDQSLSATTPAPTVASILRMGHTPNELEIGNGSRSSPIQKEHVPSSSNKLNCPPQRPKLLANLKPKISQVDDEPEDEENPPNGGGNAESLQQYVVIEGNDDRAEPATSRPGLPQRSSVVQFSNLSTTSTDNRLPEDQHVHTSLLQKATGDIRHAPSYINKRSSLYVNSPDFSKKSLLVSPVASSSPTGSPFNFGTSMTTSCVNSTEQERPVLHENYGLSRRVSNSTVMQQDCNRPPVVMMQLKGGDQNAFGSSSRSNNLNTLKMNPPDFSKISSSLGEASMSAEVHTSAMPLNHPSRGPPAKAKPPPSMQFQSPTIDPQNFNEIRKKFNYISDLQLKPPTEPQQRNPNHVKPVGPSVTYPNLYVNTPEFTTQKFSGPQLPNHHYPSQGGSTRPPPNEQRRDYIHLDSRYPQASSSRSVAQEIPQQYSATKEPGTHYSPYGPSSATTAMPNPLNQYNVIYQEDHSRTHRFHPPSTANLKSEALGKGEGITTVKNEGQRYSLYPQAQMGPYSDQIPYPQANRATTRGESSTDYNHQNSVIKQYLREEQLQQPRPGIPPTHTGNSKSAMLPSQAQQPPSGISLKQQHSDLLSTDLKRIHSPNQATSGNFLQISTYSNMGPMNPPNSSTYVDGRPTRPSSSVSSYSAQLYQQKSSPSPTLSRMVPSPTTKPSSSYKSMANLTQMDHRHQIAQYSMERQHSGNTEKYALTGDLSRAPVGVIVTGQQPIGSTDLYMNHYGRGQVPPSIPKQEAQSKEIHEYYRQSGTYLSPHPMKMNVSDKPSPQTARPNSVQLPLSNYPQFQPGALICAPSNMVEPSSSNRGTPKTISAVQVPVKVSDRTSPQVFDSKQTTGMMQGSSGPRIKREIPLDLSVKTVKTKADSTGGFYEVGHTRTHKVNYVPDFGQNRSVDNVAGPSHQNVPQAPVPYRQSKSYTGPGGPILDRCNPKPSQTSQNRAPVDTNYNPGQSPSGLTNATTNSTLSQRPYEYSGGKSQYVTYTPEAHPPQRLIRQSHQNRTPPELTSQNTPGFNREANPYYRVAPSITDQSVPPRSNQSTHEPRTSEPILGLERKRHADFAHLSTIHQPPGLKTMKLNEPYHQGATHYGNVYMKGTTPPTPEQQRKLVGGPTYNPHEPSTLNNKFEQVPSQYLNHYQPVGAPGFQPQVPSNVSQNPDPRQVIQAYHSPSYNTAKIAANRYPVDVKSCFSPAPGAVHPPHQQHRPSPSQTEYPPSQPYYNNTNIQQNPLSNLSIPPPINDQFHRPKTMAMSDQISGAVNNPAPIYSAQQGLPPVRHQPPMPHSNEGRLVPPIVKGSGADKSVISKLKNAIEEKQHQRLMQMQAEPDVNSEESKSDIASILAARIRTKGELKGFIGNQQAQALVNPKVDESKPIAVNINPKERFDPPPDMEGVSSFDLMDWGSACNDFVEQLQTGKKKAKRRRVQKVVDINIKAEPQSHSPRDLQLRDMPPESLVPREAITAAATLGNTPAVANSDGSSDEDKPLVLIKQLSLEKARFTESDAKSRSSSLMMSSVKSHTSSTTKGIKEKRLLQEKRYAARIANATSSESETELKKLPKPIRRKKNQVKPFLVKQEKKLAEPDTSNKDSESVLKSDAKRHIAVVENNLAAKKLPASAPILKRKSTNDISSGDSDAPVLRREPATIVDQSRNDKVMTQTAEKKRNKKPEVDKSVSTSDPSDSETLSKKSKNAEAAKSTSDAKAGGSKESPTPTRTNKIRRQLPKDVGPASVRKTKSKAEEHMTRSKKKQKLAEQIANSLVLRNDKVVQSSARVRNKPGPKGKLSPDSKRPGRPLKVDVVVSSTSSSDDASSSLESDCETIVSTRLRPRKSKAHELAAVRSSGVEKKGTDPSPPVKSRPSDIGKNDVVVAQAATTGTKRGGVKRSRQDLKETAPQDADELIDTSPNQDEKVRGSKKGRKNNGDPQKFGPGWEDQLYEFKRSLKVPASLITIESPKWHRVSTSLPDLEPRSNSEEDDLDASVYKSSYRREPAEGPKKPSSKLSSIIDMVHERVIRPFKRLAHLGDTTPTPPLAVAGQNKTTDLLLPTPVLVKSVRSKGVGVEHVEEVVTKIMFPRKTAKKSRTRREYNVEKNNEIIREIFGGEHRPASAPPGCGPPAAPTEKGTKTACEKLDEYETIVFNKVSYEQKFEEYLGLYSSSTIAEDTNHVSNKSLQLAMSIDEAIKEDVLIFRRPLIQGEDPEHGGLVKRKIGRRSYTRRKGSSGFDYIRKKKRPMPVNMNSLAPSAHCELLELRRRTQIMFLKDRNEYDISKEIKGWVLNKGVGESVLHKATRMNLLDVVAYCLIRLDMIPDQKDNAGYTPLHEACSRGHLDIARLLLQHGANATETSPSGIRPLHDAVENGDLEIVRLLLAYGADPKLATYAGQTPMDLAEDDEEMEDFLKAYLNDLQSGGFNKKPWRFDGAWRSYCDNDSGFNVLEGAPEVDHTDQKRLNRRRRRLRRKTSGDEFVKVVPNTRKSSSLNLTVKKLSNELNGLSGDALDEVDNNNSKGKDEAVVATALEAGQSGQMDSQGNSDEGELFEFEECETVLPPVYLLKDEGTDNKWCNIQDILNVLHIKSKETLLKQICPPNGKKDELVREFKMNDFLQKATCLQLLCSGEKLNIRASKVILIKYTESVKDLLGVQTMVMRL